MPQKAKTEDELIDEAIDKREKEDEAIKKDETTGDYELGTLTKKCRYPQKFHEHH